MTDNLEELERLLEERAVAYCYTWAPSLALLRSLIATAREVEGLRHALVTAMIPIEAILLSGADAAHCQDVRDALHDARNTAKAALESKGG